MLMISNCFKQSMEYRYNLIINMCINISYELSEFGCTGRSMDILLPVHLLQYLITIENLRTKFRLGMGAAASNYPQKRCLTESSDIPKSIPCFLQVVSMWTMQRDIPSAVTEVSDDLATNSTPHVIILLARVRIQGSICPVSMLVSQGIQEGLIFVSV